MKPDFKIPFYAKASLVFIGSFAFISMLCIGQRIIVPVIYATIIAVVLSPVVDFFVRKKLNRIIAIAITLLLASLATILVIMLLCTQIMQFGDSFGKLSESLHQLLVETVAWVSTTFNISPRKINVWLAAKNAEMLNGTVSVIGQTIINTGSVLIILVLIPVYIFMILFYQPLLLEFIHRLFSADKHTDVNEVLTATKKIIRSYLVGLLIEGLIVATLNSVSLLLIGIDYAILLGLIGAILNVIPYIGGIIAVALPMLIALATKSPSYALLVMGAYILIQFVDNHYLIPNIVASKVKINALVSVVVVLLGGALWGVPGMFLSIPLTAIIKVVFDHIEPLKPWGFLLGNNVPGMPKSSLIKK
ncbi:MAG TPA: AI-2E family transporter [Bacteroidia bacterium]|jgi:predicted PurR-regulated permease PerM|nr:AI-2E family transporter [Bacteroidia bacterium]